MKFLLVIAVMILAVAMSMAMGGLLVAIVGAMFLETPFSDGWHAAWDNKGYLVLFIFLIAPMFAGRN